MGLMKPLLYICKGLKGDSESNSVQLLGDQQLIGRGSMGSKAVNGNEPVSIW